MELIYASLAYLLMQAVAAAPNPFPLPTPAPTLIQRQENPTLTNTTTTATAAYAATLTGEFTGADGGLYEVTSESNYVLVAGHTLSAGGPDALVGAGEVTVGSDGFMANGQMIAFLSISSTSSAPMSTSMSSSAQTTSMPASSSAAAAGGSSSSSSAGAVATGVPLAGAMLGGLMGLALL